MYNELVQSFSQLPLIVKITFIVIGICVAILLVPLMLGILLILLIWRFVSHPVSKLTLAIIVLSISLFGTYQWSKRIIVSPTINDYLNESYTNNATESAEIPNTEADQEYTVIDIVDGDTIKVDINGSLKTVRLIGIDTPETVDPRKDVECFGKEASAKIAEMIEGGRVRLEKDVSETDRFGRLLRYVFSKGQFINLILVSEGYARASSYPPDVRYQEDFSGAEKQASQEKRGLWGNACACEKEETARECVSCNIARVTLSAWDCSNVQSEEHDKTCSTLCQAESTSSME